MQKNEVMSRLETLFQDFFEDPELVLTEETNGEDILDWDSLAHVRLILAVEQQFSVHFESEEIASLNKVGDLLDALINRM